MQHDVATESFGLGLAAFLGLLEGLTEFLPVSSTGHLILAGHFLGFTGEVAVSVDICIQLGAVLAILAYERKKIFSLLHEGWSEQTALRKKLWGSESFRRSESDYKAILKESWNDHPNFWFLVGLAIAFLPSAVVGFTTHEWIEIHLFSPHTIAVSLIIGGMIILGVERGPHRARIHQLQHVGIRTALLVGIAQCFALIPGTSRSGSTIIGGLLAGLDRKVATEYSFFLALPTMIAATGYKLVDSYHLFNVADALALFLGMLVSFVVAWTVIALFLTFVKRHTLQVFAYYRMAIGTILLIILS